MLNLVALGSRSLTSFRLAGPALGPLLVLAAQVRAQEFDWSPGFGPPARAWFRDPPSAKGTSLSDALSFEVGP